MIPKKYRKLQADLLFFLYSVLLIIGFFLSFELLYFQKIFPGVKIAGINLEGKNQVQAAKILNQASQNQDKTIKLIFNDRVWELDLTELKFQYQPEFSSRRAYLIGRSGNLTTNLADQAKALTQEINLDFDYQLDQDLLTLKIASLASQIDAVPIPPSIAIIKTSDQSTIQIQTGQQGQQLKQEELQNQLQQQLGQLARLQLILPVQEVLPAITPEQVQQTEKRAQQLLGKTLTISFSENSWPLKEAELISWLDFGNGYDQQKIASFTAQLAQSIDRPAQNALFNFSNNRVLEFKPAKDGQTLNQEETIRAINQALTTLENQTQPVLTLNPNVGLQKPAITNEQVNNLGIKELLGKGESWFYGSIASRIHNLQLASGRLNGILIAPGEVFSFNKTLGDVSIQTGFQKAYIIKEGRTVLGDGGGVCQVSTTLFRAALNAGLPIIERKAHAYRVSYYEYNSEVGQDATVFDPSEDLKIQNDTPAHILIQTNVDLENLKLTFELYGTADGRQVTISKSRLWDQAAPPPALYQDDPTLPAGVVKQVDWSAWGAKTAFDWKVVRDGQVLQERTFYSVYRPWQAIFLKGTAGQ